MLVSPTSVPLPDCALSTPRRVHQHAAQPATTGAALAGPPEFNEASRSRQHTQHVQGTSPSRITSSEAPPSTTPPPQLPCTSNHAPFPVHTSLHTQRPKRLLCSFQHPRLRAGVRRAVVLCAGRLGRGLMCGGSGLGVVRSGGWAGRGAVQRGVMVGALPGVCARMGGSWGGGKVQGSHLGLLLPDLALAVPLNGPHVPAVRLVIAPKRADLDAARVDQVNGPARTAPSGGGGLRHEECEVALAAACARGQQQPSCDTVHYYAFGPTMSLALADIPPA
jgi:hypothetical protein